MKLTYDREADAAYLYLGEGVTRGGVAKTVPGEGEAEGINLDLDAEDRLVGIEVLGASKRLPARALKRAAAAG